MSNILSFSLDIQRRNISSIDDEKEKKKSCQQEAKEFFVKAASFGRRKAFGRLRLDEKVFAQHERVKKESELKKNGRNTERKNLIKAHRALIININLKSQARGRKRKHILEA